MSWLLNWLLYELAIKLTINDLKLSVGYTITLAFIGPCIDFCCLRVVTPRGAELISSSGRVQRPTRERDGGARVAETATNSRVRFCWSPRAAAPGSRGVITSSTDHQNLDMDTHTGTAPRLRLTNRHCLFGSSEYEELSVIWVSWLLSLQMATQFFGSIRGVSSRFQIVKLMQGIEEQLCRCHQVRKSSILHIHDEEKWCYI